MSFPPTSITSRAAALHRTVFKAVGTFAVLAALCGCQHFTGSAPAGLASVLLARQADCSLTSYAFNSVDTAAHTFNAAATPNQDARLHTLAALSSAAGKFPQGCTSATRGQSGALQVLLGVTDTGKLIGAGADLDGNLHATLIDPAGSFSDTRLPLSDVTALYTGDLNADGNPDLIATTATGVYAVLRNNDDTVAAPTAITSGPIAAVVLDDFNEDGKLDIAVLRITADGAAYASIQIFPGNGDGTFAAPLSGPVPTGTPTPGATTAALTSSGHRDILLGSGTVLLGNGKGSFIEASGTGTPGLPASTDFNADGQADIAVATPTSVRIFLGHGDGTFTPAETYPNSFASSGLITTDLDGDGAPDLLLGTAGSGYFLPAMTAQGATVLMGRGDGTFRPVSLPINASATSSAVSPHAATTTSLTSTTVSTTTGAPITFLVTVSPATATGTVTFLDGTATIGTASLAGGSASFTISTLSAATHNITASYGGDANNTGSVSAVLAVRVAVPADFTLALSIGTPMVEQGMDAGTTATVTPIGGFNLPTTFTCSGLPQYAACYFSTNPITPNGTAASTTIVSIRTATVTTDDKRYASLTRPPTPFHSNATAITLASVSLGGLLCIGIFARRRRIGLPARLASLLLLFTATAGLSGCTDHEFILYTPTGTYSVTITATAGTITHSANYSIMVTPRIIKP